MSCACNGTSLGRPGVQCIPFRPLGAGSGRQRGGDEVVCIPIVAGGNRDPATPRDPLFSPDSRTTFDEAWHVRRPSAPAPPVKSSCLDTPPSQPIRSGQRGHRVGTKPHRFISSTSSATSTRSSLFAWRLPFRLSWKLDSPSPTVPGTVLGLPAAHSRPCIHVRSCQPWTLITSTLACTTTNKRSPRKAEPLPGQDSWQIPCSMLDHSLYYARSDRTDPDAGLKAEDHYARHLPPWRYRLRQMLLPVVRRETPHLHRIQQTLRTPALDSYFAMTANLGTHTFFMVFLPVLFWCGLTEQARALVHMLAAGVFFSGWLKDLVCVPRPLSPPLQRITMSGSAALEYGFPSTHSTNAASVALYIVYEIMTGSVHLQKVYKTAAILVAVLYLLSIVAGRVYCGMHGFVDILVGLLLGALITAVQIIYGPSIDAVVAHGGWTVVAIITFSVLLAVRFHPEPADDCPCFDDSVAFAGVVIGIEAGHFHFANTSFSWSEPIPGTVPFSLSSLGWIRVILRLSSGVAVIYAWRALMKPFLLRILPPLFRQTENVNLDLPRRFFKSASQYKHVPTLRHDDNVIPSAKDIPAFFNSLTRRKRNVSIGPQSEADAREHLALREIRKRHSWRELKAAQVDEDASAIVSNEARAEAATTTSTTTAGTERADSGASSGDEGDADAETVISHAIGRQRVRYDVEVVTKLVVYMGIGLVAADWSPILFTLIGLDVS